VTALQSLRTVVHALRGWPTPLGIALNSTEPLFDPDGGVQDPAVAVRFDLVAEQVVSFAQNWSTKP
jgi:FMN reductase